MGPFETLSTLDTILVYFIMVSWVWFASVPAFVGMAIAGIAYKSLADRRRPPLSASQEEGATVLPFPTAPKTTARHEHLRSSGDNHQKTTAA